MSEELKKEKKLVEEVDEKQTKEKKVNSKVSDADIYIAKLNEDLELQKKKAEEYCDGLKRNMAEFDNFKKRITKEKDSMYDTIVCDVAKKLLPVMDNFEKAINSECKDKPYKDGMNMIFGQLNELLMSYGIEKIQDMGTTFDPELHEAVMSVEDETKNEKEIVEVFRTGYRLKDKIVRHSLVKVAN